MINKQFFKFGIIIALAFGTLPAIADVGPHIIVGSDTAVVGSATPLVIPVDYHGNATAVGFQVDISYDDANLTVDVTNCGGVILGTALVGCSNPSAGIVRIAILAASALPDGSLGTLEFNVSGAAIGNHDLLVPVADELYTDIGAQPVASTGSDAGQITITAAGLLPQTITSFTAAPPSGNVGDSSTLSATADSGLRDFWNRYPSYLYGCWQYCKPSRSWYLYRYR
ncbi:MAG: hypothetical protein L3J22_04605 [Xanthomonadales bacterium]|nr:hypothetical protein [Xanthomonadales bacterium]